MPRGCLLPSQPRDTGTLKNELEILVTNKELETDFVTFKLDNKLTWELTSEGGGGKRNNPHVHGICLQLVSAIGSIHHCYGWGTSWYLSLQEHGDTQIHHEIPYEAQQLHWREVGQKPITDKWPKFPDGVYKITFMSVYDPARSHPWQHTDIREVTGHRQLFPHIFVAWEFGDKQLFLFNRLSWRPSCHDSRETKPGTKATEGRCPGA